MVEVASTILLNFFSAKNNSDKEGIKEGIFWKRHL